MLKPTGLVSGHYECRSFAESLPILKEFLALSVVDEKAGEKILRHPNTGWQIVVHANGADAPIKSMRNHYGVRVATNAEVDRATEYLESRKSEFAIKVIKPRENHNAYSVHFYEPGGNYWEIESYEHAVEHGMGKTTNPHWIKTISRRIFRRQRLRTSSARPMERWRTTTSPHPNSSTKKPSAWKSSNFGPAPATSSIPTRRGTSSASKRKIPTVRGYRVTNVSPSPSIPPTQSTPPTANSWQNRDSWKLRELETIRESSDAASFLFADLNGNWWEISHARLVTHVP